MNETDEAVRILDASAWAVHGGATALAMAGQTEEARRWVERGLGALKNAVIHLEKTTNTGEKTR